MVLFPRIRLARRIDGAYLASLILLALVYLLSAKLGLSLAKAPEQVTAVWPPTGIALVALITLGYRYWPAILVGAFAANVSTHETAAVASAIAVGNMLEALGGTYLLRRVVNFKTELNNLQGVLGLIILAGFISTLISATIGTTALGLGGNIAWSDYSTVWLRWWIGDMMGDLILAPLIFVLLKRRFWRTILAGRAEMLALFTFTTVISVFIFGGYENNIPIKFPLPYLAFPLIIWAALRFSEIGAIVCTFIITSTATIGTLNNRGPFSRGNSVDENLIFLYLFIGILAITSLILAAVVAERNRTEQALLAQAQGLAKARARALRSVARSEESERQRDKLVSMASHELKTPLTSTKLFTDILQKQLKQTPGSKQAVEYASRVSQGLDRLIKLTGDLIDTNRTRTGKLKLDRSRVQVDELLAAAVADIQLTAQEHQLRFRGRAPIKARLDEVRIRQVLINILNNSIRHSPPGREILVTSVVKKRELIVEVRDQGEGIPKKEQSKIFEPFYQREGRRYRGNLGLGLHISRQIIELHGGKIWVESQPKKGATFAFSIPL